MKSHFQTFFAVIFVSSLLILAACSGPAQAPQAQPKAETADKQERVPAVDERPAPTPAPVEERRTQVTPKPKPAVKEIPKQPVTPRSASTGAQPAASAQKTASSDSSPSAASSGPGTLTLPAPVAPPIDAPLPPPAETKPVVVEPAPRQIRVPSGTLVSVRMIDSVDSGTAHVGETFKASLDAPIVVDNETVFPKGSEVYVKLSKVESAGRISGKSEVQLQLNRIFLGRKSYMLESSTYVSTGASQSARTAKTGALGAAIGAAIGAISGGGKGAVIGGATGAGAGVGVEAVRKGEQVRVDSEARLDFRLEESVEVTVFSSRITSPPRNNPSVPPRFGTRQQ